MDEMWNWAKDNYQFISLLVGLIGVIIAIISLVVEIKKRKKDVASKIAEKQARLDAINGIHFFSRYDKRWQCNDRACFA